MRVMHPIPDDLRHRIKQSTSKFESLLADIGATMERTRQTYGFVQSEFADMLGLSKYQYSRFLQSSSEQTITKAIFIFCYVFGYDLQALSKSNVTARATDTALMEVAASLGGIPDDTITAIIDLVKRSDEMRASEKKQVEAALTAYVAERQKFKSGMSKLDFSSSSATSPTSTSDDVSTIIVDATTT